jgi:hypothetical protein
MSLTPFCVARLVSARQRRDPTALGLRLALAR